MILIASVKLNLKVKEVTEAVQKAARLAMRDTVIAVSADTIEHSPQITGNNRRSIAGEVSGMGLVVSGGEGQAEGVVDDSKLQGAVYSTSGYGGFLEVGTGIYGAKGQPITPKTAKMLVWEGKGGELIFAKAVRGRPATPYFKPAMDRNFTVEKLSESMKRYLK